MLVDKSFDGSSIYKAYESALISNTTYSNIFEKYFNIGNKVVTSYMYAFTSKAFLDRAYHKI